MNISYSFGIIDLFHFGHLNALKKAHKNTDIHFFGLVSDRAAIAWLGGIVSNEEERKAVLESISCVDEVMIQTTLDPTENLKIIYNKYPYATITLYHGNDWEIVPAERFLKEIGGSVKLFDYYDKLSPIKILQALNNRSNHSKQYKNLISTKANTLLALKDRLKLSRIEELSIYTVGQCNEGINRICEEINLQYNGSTIVVRSSSKNEDCFEKSNAGHYESILDVDSLDKSSVKKALEAVCNSYGKDGEVAQDEQILIQRQTEEVVYSGVIFTRDIQYNRPYYVINYDDNGATDSVTSGIGGKVIWIAHDIVEEELPPDWRGIIVSVREIELLLKGMTLDIEFALNKKGETIIFQVRPLAASYKFKRDVNADRLLQIKNRTVKEFKEFRHDENKRILSDMAFWNPAEIIGDNPRNLDFSLYREIITKKAWTAGLRPMGYQFVDEDLMYKFANKPYICVDYAFRALIPQNLDEEVKSKLIKFYGEKLSSDFTAHDKIEFEVVLSCFDLETEDRLKELLQYGFTDDEIKKIHHQLYDLTFKNIKSYKEVLVEDTCSLEKLENIRHSVESLLNENNSVKNYVKCFRMLIEALEEYGTPQFSRQARYAFIARALCNSMIYKGYISKMEYDLFMCTIETVTTEFERDFRSFLTGYMEKTVFDERYGHLRAGTYDIRTCRYDQMHFSIKKDSRQIELNKKMGMDLPLNSITKALKDFDIDVTYQELISFLKAAFEQREKFKFIFTKSLSRAIEIVASIGYEIGLDRNDLSYLEVPEILAADFYDDSNSLKNFWNIIIEKRKEIHNINSALILPSVISNELDFDFIQISEARPNFVTEKIVSGEVVILEEQSDKDITDKIVVIEKADPGFDWIFAKGIKALVTKYGGVASHMAIRCAEFEIPAAIGCGENIYNVVKEISNLHLDCKNKKITEEIQ
ncbi:MAG: hypothetical protein E7222_13555 [Clostridiales bacterium]|nr:hypothetical protein [Clostridiales bacterium]